MKIIKSRNSYYRTFKISWLERELIYNGLCVRILKLAKALKEPHSKSYKDFLKHEIRNSYKLFVRFVSTNYEDKEHWKKDFFKSFKNRIRKEASSQ